MANYIVLLRYTPQGAANIKQGPARIEAARQAFRSMGGELKSVYLVMGQYDAITFAEAPDDETIAKICLALGSQGNVRSETLRAFSEDEFKKIVAALP